MDKLLVKPKSLGKAIYKATRTKEEFKYFKSAFSILARQGDLDQIQIVLNKWHEEKRISVTERDVLKGVV